MGDVQRVAYPIFLGAEEEMNYEIHTGDVFDGLSKIPDESVQCCITSPPYWGLRDYGSNGQIGLEKTPEEYVEKMVRVFREVRRVLRKDGTLWLNLGDSYASGDAGQHREQRHNRRYSGGAFEITSGLKPKDLVGIPWRVAFALQADGWWLRQDIIWAKPNPMPESVTDRCTKAHEYIFLLTKSAKYYYDAEAVKEAASENEVGWKRSGPSAGYHVPDRNDGGKLTGPNRWNSTRNARSVWTMTTKPFKGAHFATFPPEIPERCIKAGSKKEDMILDPFAGSGTTGEVALRLGRKFIGIELNEKYVKDLVIPRLEGVSPLGIKN